MRAPIGFRISTRRQALEISQAALARQVGISASYLNLIEHNKRDIGGSLLLRLAAELKIDIDELTGEAEHQLLPDVEEAFADPVLEPLRPRHDAARDLVAQQPAAPRRSRACTAPISGAQANADDYADRLRSDPLLGQLLHRILSGITAVRSSAEILEDVAGSRRERAARGSCRRSRARRAGLTDVARNLIGQFERRGEGPADALADARARRPDLRARQLFSGARSGGRRRCAPRSSRGAVRRGDADRAARAARSAIAVRGARGARSMRADFPGQYHFDAGARIMWFQTSAIAATRQFQLTRLYAELAAPDAIEREVLAPELSSDTARRLGLSRAVGSYLAGAIVFPYDAVPRRAEALRYDIDALRQVYTASFEQVAHRLVTLRRPGEEGMPFGFLRSDPAGRLTKHFPLPGLLLPNSGHACPLWAIYGAFRTPDALVRQVVRFSDGSRYLFLAKAQARRGRQLRRPRRDPYLGHAGLRRAARRPHGLWRRPRSRRSSPPTCRSGRAAGSVRAATAQTGRRRRCRPAASRRRSARRWCRARFDLGEAG